MIMKAVTLLLTITLVQGYANFRNNIPNGGGVPNPCSSGYWSSVGHYSINSGTVEKNQFALVSFYVHIQWKLANPTHRGTREMCRIAQDVGILSCRIAQVTLQILAVYMCNVGFK